MRVLDLFSGIGAFSLGLEWAGMQTVGFCEVEPACRFWLSEHWPGVPIFEDIRTLTGEAIRERCATVDLVAGGVPCQPVSLAGKRKGASDERWLWPDALRIVREVRPRWVILENVPGLRTLGADEIIEGLEAEGYTCWPLVVGADDAGLPHRRKRVWIVAHADSASSERERADRRESDAGANGRNHALGSCAVGVAHADCTGQPRERVGGLLDGQRAARGHDVDGCGERPLGNADGNTVREQPRRGRGPRGQDPAEPARTSIAVGDANGAVLEIGTGVGGDARAECAAAERASPARELADADGGGRGVLGCARAGVWPITDSEGARRLDDAQGEPERRRDDAARQPDVARPGDPTWRGVVARPGERQHEWEAPRLADANDAGRSRPGTDAHAGRDGSTEVGGRQGARESQSSVGDAAARTARWLARLATATRRARLRALGNCVCPQTVAAVGRAIMNADGR